MIGSYATSASFIPWLPVPTAIVPLADTYNPKFWAKRFREFLFEIIPPKTESVRLPSDPAIRCRLLRRTRAGPGAIREWKMKLWKQAFA